LEHRRKLKQKAEQCINEKPRSIITNINLSNISEEAIAISGSYNAYRQLVHREIQIHQPEYPPKPQRLAEISYTGLVKTYNLRASWNKRY
jgi:hypothetical protein